jgi:hypothetical protein
LLWVNPVFLDICFLACLGLGLGLAKKSTTAGPPPKHRATHVAQREAPLALNASLDVSDNDNDVTPRLHYRHHAALSRPRTSECRARGGPARRRALPRALRLAASGEPCSARPCVRPPFRPPGATRYRRAAAAAAAAASVGSVGFSGLRFGYSPARRQRRPHT